MKNLLLSVLALSTILIISSSFMNEEMPNPEDYAKKLVETLRKNDKQEYLKAFEFTTKDYHWLHDRMQNDAHVSDENRNEWNRKFSDTTEILDDMNRMLNNSYDEISEWVKAENINLNELQYQRIYYELEYEQRITIHIIDESIVVVKHKEKYYGISVRDAGYVNGRWVLGRISSISEYDQYFESVYGGYGNSYDYESVDTAMAAPADTVAISADAIVDSAYAMPMYEENSMLTKKQLKLKAKIAKKEKELFKLYDDLYKEGSYDYKESH